MGIFSYVRTLTSLGLVRAGKSVTYKLQKSLFLPDDIAEQSIAPTDWHYLEKRGFTLKRSLITTAPFLDGFFRSANKRTVLKLANNWLQKKSPASWHYDALLYQQDQKADSFFDSDVFYTHIRVPCNKAFELKKDIKVPWKSGRFDDAFVLAVAYQLRPDAIYGYAFKNEVISFLDANKFCYGIHWFNGMEVAIRAIHWIIALDMLYPVLSDDQYFLRRIVCSLYDHMRYLELNWEWYDGRTNNHYLANLIGYGYLADFFGESKKFAWFFKELVREFSWQVFPDGTSYEGSTAYHLFVAELFVHGFLLAQAKGYVIDDAIVQKLRKMKMFIDDCTPAQYRFVTIGDDDSGALFNRALYNPDLLWSHIVPAKKRHQPLAIAYYPNFGLAIVQQHSWHVTLRHAAYQRFQPSAHFHQDIASVTIFYNGIPVIIDPGTYVYTASGAWRNYFRASGMHNTIMVPDGRALPADPFYLPLGYKKQESVNPLSTTIIFAHGLVTRTVDVQKDSVTLVDLCVADRTQDFVWNFVFDASVVLTQHTHGWSVVMSGVTLMCLSNTLHFELVDTWISPEYGIKRKSYGLRAIKTVEKNCSESVTIQFLLNI